MKKVSQGEISICGTWRLTGNAAKMVLRLMDKKKEEGIRTYGKEAAIQALLNELYNIKNGLF